MAFQRIQAGPNGVAGSEEERGVSPASRPTLVRQEELMDIGRSSQANASTEPESGRSHRSRR